MRLRYIPLIEGDGAYQMALDETIMRALIDGKGENTFRINAYRKAARILREYPEDVEEVWKNGKLDKNFKDVCKE